MKIIHIVLFYISLSYVLGQQQLNSTIKCRFAHFLSPTNTCVECLTSCSKCKNLQIPCQGCAQGFKLSFDSTKCDSCQIGQLICNQNQKTCQKYYKKENGQCRPICVVQNCLTCPSIFATTCDVCLTGYQMSADRTSCIAKTSLKVSSGWTRNLQQETPSASATSASNSFTATQPTRANQSITVITPPINNLSNTIANPNLTENTISTNNRPNVDTAIKPIERVNPTQVNNIGTVSRNGTSSNSSFRNQPAVITKNASNIDQTKGTNTFGDPPKITNDNSFPANIGFSIPSVPSESESGFGNFDSNILTNLDNQSPIGGDNAHTPQDDTKKTPINSTGNTSAIPSLKMPNTTTNSVTQTPITLKNDINRNCGINQYDDPDKGCLTCDKQCATCIGSSDHCLQCKQNRTMIGWKCVTDEYVAYNISLAVPKGKQAYALGEGINEFKTNFLRFILPSSYVNTPQSAITLNSAKLDSTSRILALSGVVDKVGNTNISQLSKQVDASLNYNSNIGIFGIVNSSVAPYPDPTQLLNNNTIPVSTNTNNKNEPVIKKINLAAIIVPSVIGGLLLFMLVSCLICYFCKCGIYSICFKKPENTNEQNNLETERPIQHKNNSTLVQTPKPIIIPVSTVTYQPIVAVIPIVASNTETSKIKNITQINPAIPYTATSINNNIEQKKAQPIKINQIQKLGSLQTNSLISKQVGKIPTPIIAQMGPSNTFTPIQNQSGKIKPINFKKNQQIKAVNNISPIPISRAIDISNLSNNMTTIKTVTNAAPVIKSAISHQQQTKDMIVNPNPPKISVSGPSQQNQIGIEKYAQNKPNYEIMHTKQNIIMAGNQQIKNYYAQDRKINSNGQIGGFTNQQVIISPSRVISYETLSSAGTRPLLPQQTQKTQNKIIVPTSSKIIQGESVNYLTGNITKHSYKDGKIVTQHVSSTQNLPEYDFAPPASIQYKFLNDNIKKQNKIYPKQTQQIDLRIKSLSSQTYSKGQTQYEWKY